MTTDVTEQPPLPATPERHGLVHRLYHGETSFPLIQQRRKFYAASLLLVVIALSSMAFRQFNLGVEFKGGNIFSVSAPSNVDLKATRAFVDSLGVRDAIVQTVKTSNGDTKIRLETPPLETQAEQTRIGNELAKRFNADPDTQLDIKSVGASWGKQVTKKALQGLIVFLLAVVAYISFRFEPKMAAAAIIALVHDLVLAAGVYSVTQFVVTPSTVIALLTVLGYSLYDTIVVFDKVAENTKGIERRGTQTYAEASELAVNQTFMRSINTSLIALLPVSGLLFVGALLLGAGTLKDLSLALFVGLASGAYSSLFLATPLLADFKEREPRFQALAKRVSERRTKGASASSPLRLSQQSDYAPAGAASDAAPAVRPAAKKAATKKRKKGSRPTSKRKR